MNDMSSMSRESRKDQLRRRMITPGTPRRLPEEDSEEVVKRAHKKAVRRRLRVLAAVLVLLAVCAGVLYWYQRFYQLKTAVPGWERQLEREEGSFVGYERFGENLLKYSKHGASYIDASGKDVWILSYEMNAPVAAVCGDYAVIADQQGNHLYICDLTGCQGEASTALPIVKATVSAQGVAAVILEDPTASYIYFYRKDGTEIQLYMKGILGGALIAVGTLILIL